MIIFNQKAQRHLCYCGAVPPAQLTAPQALPNKRHLCLALGLGLLESAYEVCLVYELRLKQLLSYLRLYGGYSRAAH